MSPSNPAIHGSCRIHKHFFNWLHEINVAASRPVAAVGEIEFVTSAQHHRPAIFVGGFAPLFERLCHRLLADERNRSVPARHVEHLVPRPVRSVRGDLHEKLRSRQRTLVHDIENDLRHAIERARSVRIRAAKTGRLVPIVRDRTPLPKEMLQLLAKFRFISTPGGDVGLVIRRKNNIEFRQRATLDAVKMLRPEKV